MLRVWDGRIYIAMSEMFTTRRFATCAHGIRKSLPTNMNFIRRLNYIITIERETTIRGLSIRVDLKGIRYVSFVG